MGLKRILLFIHALESIPRNGDRGTLELADELASKHSSPLHTGTKSSNSCINTWIPNGGTLPTPAQLTLIFDDQKVAGHRRIAYQVPKLAGGPCGRSFEDAYMLANPVMFPMTATTANALKIEAGYMAGDVKKSDFALEHAISDTGWIIPRYIREGLVWLAADGATDVTVAPAAEGSNA